MIFHLHPSITVITSFVVHQLKTHSLNHSFFSPLFLEPRGHENRWGMDFSSLTSLSVLLCSVPYFLLKLTSLLFLFTLQSSASGSNRQSYALEQVRKFWKCVPLFRVWTEPKTNAVINQLKPNFFQLIQFGISSRRLFQSLIETLLQPGIVVAGLPLNEFTITLNTVFFGNGLKSICEDFRPSQTGFEGCLSPPPALL